MKSEDWRSLLRQHDPADRDIDPRRAIEIRHAAIEGRVRRSERLRPGRGGWRSRPWR